MAKRQRPSELDKKLIESALMKHIVLRFTDPADEAKKDNLITALAELRGDYEKCLEFAQSHLGLQTEQVFQILEGTIREYRQSQVNEVRRNFIRKREIKKLISQENDLFKPKGRK